MAATPVKVTVPPAHIVVGVTLAVTVGNAFTTTLITSPVLEHPVVVFFTINVPVNVPAPGLEGTVKAIGVTGKVFKLTSTKLAVVATAPQAILYLFGLFNVAV